MNDFIYVDELERNRRNLKPFKLGYFIKVNTCSKGELIVKIEDICSLVEDGDLSIINLKSMSQPVKIRHKLSEIKILLNQSSYKVIE